MDGGGHSTCIQWVADAEGGFEGAVGDAGFGFLRDEVKNCSAGCFGAGTGGGGDSYKGEKRLGDREAFAEGSVDEVEKVGGGEAGV